jgi:hypothetical protein
VALAGYDQRVDDRLTLARRGVPDEEPVLLADRGGPDRIFDQGVVDPGKRVFLVRDQHLQVVEQVRARIAQQGLRQALPGEAGHDLAEPTQRPGKLLPPEGGAGLADLRLLPFPFKPVQPGNEPQDQVRGLGPLFQRLVELAPGVGSAADANDPLRLALVAGVRAVLVGL